MKPRVFLSHSKKDRGYVERLAMDLRSARIDVWYDDWEIPPGASLRTKIFEEGISECDLFLIYLTKNSISSSWVQQELDAAFVIELEMRGGFIAIFVDSDETRQSLSVDLRSRRVPTINSESYSRCLLELTAMSWEALLKNRIEKTNKNNNLNALKLEKRIAEQELELANLKHFGVIDQEEILKELNETVIETILNQTGLSINLSQIFQFNSENLARGTTVIRIESLLIEKYHFFKDLSREVKRDLESEVVGKLVILGLVRVQPPVGEWSEIFYLTDLGKDLAFKIRSLKKEQDNNL